MQLELRREHFTDRSTTGRLFIDGVFECFTLEDVVRTMKVAGQTAIPFGEYDVIVDQSVRFRQLMPHILNVPDFSGVRIHWGNTEVDTIGCVLVGQTKTGANSIGASRAAFAAFFPKLKDGVKAGKVTISITDGRNPGPDAPKGTDEAETASNSN